MLADPNIKRAKPQTIVKTDRTAFIVKCSEAQTRTDYSGGSVSQGKRLCWAPPMNIKWPKEGSLPENESGDSRGTFIDIGRSVVSFTNVLKQDVTIILNSPRGRIDSPSFPYVRRYKRELTIRPGKTVHVSMNWGDKANIYTPMVVNIPRTTDGYRKLPYFVVMDYLIVVPDENIMSGEPTKAVAKKDSEENLEAVRVKFVQHYYATAQYSGTIETEERNPVFFLNNGTLEGMFNEHTLDGRIVSLGVTCVTKPGPYGPVLRDMWGGIQQFPNLPQGSMLTFAGVSGIFKVAGEAGLVCWDVLNDKPAASDQQLVVPAGTIASLVPQIVSIDWKDVFGWIDIVTDIVTILSIVF